MGVEASGGFVQDANRASAQRRVDDIDAFERELGRLHEEAVLVLTAQQQQAVQGHHKALLAKFALRFDVDRDQRARQLSRGMQIASLLGALALAASVFFLFYQFWGLFTPGVQTLLLLGAALGSLAVTVGIHRKDSSGYFTKLAALVAFTCFVLDLSLIGQIYNMAPSDRALVVWGAFGMLLAYALNQRLLLVAGLGCLVGFLSARVGSWGGVYWLSFGLRPENFFPAAVLMFSVPLLVSHDRHTHFEQTYRVTGLLTLFLPMLALAHFGHMSYLPLDPGLVQGGYQVLGFVVSSAVVWLGIRKGWSEVTATGMAFFVLFLYSKFFDWWWDVMPKYLFFGVLGLTALLLLLLLRRLRVPQGTRAAR